jgi:hypothetical protein
MLSEPPPTQLLWAFDALISREVSRCIAAGVALSILLEGVVVLALLQSWSPCMTAGALAHNFSSDLTWLQEQGSLKRLQLIEARYELEVCG